MDAAEELARLVKMMTITLNDSSAAIADMTATEMAIADLVDHWLTQSVDESLTLATRVTYLECAQEIIKIFRRTA